MAVRLSKLTKELNIGVQRMVDCLNKKGYTVEASPNAKIGDVEHELLIREFVTDRRELDRLLKEMHNPSAATKAELNVEEPVKEEPQVEVVKPEPIVHIKTEVSEELKPQIKTIGKIDLNPKKREEPVVEPEIKEVIVEKVEPEVRPEVKPQEEPVLAPTPAPVAAPVEEVKPVVFKEPVREEKAVEKSSEAAPKVEVVVEETPVSKAEPEKSVEVVEPTVAESEPTDNEPFRLNRTQVSMDVKQVGYIDLSTMNHSTRPAKKSKEEKKKEREEKDARIKAEKQAIRKDANEKRGVGQEGDAADKKKRSRIHKVPNSHGGGGANAAAAPGGAHPNKGAFNKQDKGSKNNFRRPEKVEVTEEDVQKQIKETLARLTNKPKKGVKYRKEKRESFDRNRQEMAELESMESRILKVTEFVTVNDLANMMNVPVIQVIKTCMNLGYMVSINQRLDAEVINFVADEFGFTTEYVSAEVADAIVEEEDSEEDLVTRPPIVTVMGHVDHGKTSLLDYIRRANVIAGEAGGITQHIGAYHVKMEDGRMITFLDTPGHEAFTAMRARGAKVTDIVIIIIAADDSVMPQTIEAINHASAAGVPIVFAINKIDKPGANSDKIRETLAGMNYLVESWGGKYQDQEVSAKKGLGINELMDKVLLEAELLELRANPNKKAIGSIIESTLDKGRGFVSTILVSNGTLKIGDVVVAGTSFGRVKAMFNERNQRVQEAGPSEPVLILGLNGAPTAGDIFNVLDTEQEARDICVKREQLQREQSLRTQKLLTLEDIGRRLAIGNFQQLNVIVKGDVDGSVEALSDSLIKLSTEEIQVRVIHKAVGQISDSDVMLAATSDAIIIGFQVRPSTSARRLADNEGVEIRHYSIIYDAIEEVKDAMEGMLSPEIKEEITATIEIREVFKITKVGTVAGCMVKEGKVKRSNKVRIIREGIVIFTGELDSLKRFKEDVKDVASGYECGLNIKNYNDIRVGDIVESFEEVEIKKTL